MQILMNLVLFSFPLDFYIGLDAASGGEECGLSPSDPCRQFSDVIRILVDLPGPHVVYFSGGQQPHRLPSSLSLYYNVTLTSWRTGTYGAVLTQTDWLNHRIRLSSAFVESSIHFTNVTLKSVNVDVEATRLGFRNVTFDDVNIVSNIGSAAKLSLTNVTFQKSSITIANKQIVGDFADWLQWPHTVNITMQGNCNITIRNMRNVSVELWRMRLKHGGNRLLLHNLTAAGSGGSKTVNNLTSLLYISAESNPRAKPNLISVTNCTFSRNSRSMILQLKSAFAIIENCTFEENIATGPGGAVLGENYSFQFFTLLSISFPSF